MSESRLGRDGPGRGALNAGDRRTSSPEAEDREYAGAVVIAFFPSLGWQEMLLLLVIGLLLYGRNLPEAGRSLGRVAAQMKRGFQEFKDQMDRDGNLREVKKTFQETTGELRRISEVPRALANPAGAMRDLANEAMSSPMPDAKEPDAHAGSDAGPANPGASDADASQAGKQPSAPTGS